MDEAEETEFLRLVTARCPPERGYELQSENDHFSLRTATMTFGLMGLAQRCMMAPRERWHEIIAEHFTNIEDAHRLQERRGQEAVDYAQIESILTVRLESIDFLRDKPRLAPMLISREYIPGVIGILTLDYPESTTSVTREQLAGWGITEADTFDRALANVRSLAPLPVQDRTIAGVSVHFVEDNVYWYTATHVLFPDAYPDSRGPYGRIFAIPNRHLFFSFPVRDSTTIDAVNALLSPNWKRYHAGPGSISPYLYWEDAHGTVSPLPSTLANERVHFFPPPAFIALLDELARRDGKVLKQR